jgi:hypothetical protein
MSNEKESFEESTPDNSDINPKFHLEKARRDGAEGRIDPLSMVGDLMMGVRETLSEQSTVPDVTPYAQGVRDWLMENQGLSGIELTEAIQRHLEKMYPEGYRLTMELGEEE